MARGPSHWPTFVAVVVIGGALGLAAAFAGIKWSIRSDVRDMTEMAVREYPGDGVLALVTFVESGERPLKWMEYHPRS